VIVGEKPICLSGGADGADLQWGMVAGKRGDMVVHWSFEGGRSRAPESELAILTLDQLKEADPFLVKANKTLKRRFPPSSPYVTNLLRRNLYQVRDADSIYAVSTIEKSKVQGGTAWAVQMFIDRFDGKPCNAYVYDQSDSTWYVWEGLWTPIDSPPVPEGVYAAVGSRDLLANGKAAIRTLMGYQPPVAAVAEILQKAS
jgi:hypothetical protein